MGKHNLQREEVEQIVKSSISFAEVLEKLNIPTRGNNIQTIKNFLIKNNIAYSHFTHKARTYKIGEKVKIEEYIENRKKISSSKLRERLIKEGLKQNKCEICGLIEWKGKPIQCQLHHINGNHLDNRLENLQMLCPNCHTQTDTYGRIKKERKIYYCPECGKEISKRAKRCLNCSNEKRRTLKETNKDSIIEDIKNSKTITEVAKKYSVSETLIRRWIKKYNIKKYYR